MSRSRLLVLVFLAWAGLLLAPALAPAHGTFGLVVPSEPFGRPHPTVDGIAGTGEYVNAWRLSRIFYRPRFNWDPARMYFLACDGDLYVCIQGLPVRTGSVVPFVSLSFDVNHNGGATPDADDLAFMIDENGATSVNRGTGNPANPWAPASGVTGWEAHRATLTELTWGVEFRIPLSLIGGGTQGALTGIRVCHNWLQFIGDDYAWGASAAWDNPNTWGDLLWGGAPVATSDVAVDFLRVTQGLEYDWHAGVPYDLIAGKETTIITQLYTHGPLAAVHDISFHIRRIAPASSDTMTTDGFRMGGRWLNLLPYGYMTYDTDYGLDLDGSIFDVPGDYELKATVHLEGDPAPHELDLGVWTFRPTADLRLIILPWTNPYDTNPMAWGPELMANLLPALQDVGRMYPIRRGVGPLNFPTAGRSHAGLRYILMNAGGGPSDPDFTASDRRGRALMNDELNRFNYLMGFIDPLNRMDRIDRSLLLAGVTHTQGGQAQYGWNSPSAGAGFDPDPNGGSSTVIAQEIAHCLWQVRDTSPNSMLSNHSHSGDASLVLYHGFPVINMLNHRDIRDCHNLMYPWFWPGVISFTEGYEWNDMRQVLLGLAGEPYPMHKPQAAGGPIFYFVGQIDKKDKITVDYTQILPYTDFPLTPAVPASPYSLHFLSGTGADLGGLGFKVDFSGAVHDPSDTPPGLIGLLMSAPLPAGAKSIVIRNGGKTLFSRAFSSAAPVVSNVGVSASGQGGVDLTWKVTDADTPATSITCNIFYKADAQDLPMLVAGGLKGTAYHFATGMVAPTSAGRLVVEASDGLNAGQGTSNAFSVAAKPPVVAILTPQTTSTLVANQPFTLRGSGWDLGLGPLEGSAMVWSEGKTHLGDGSVLKASLAAGAHTLTLKAITPGFAVAQSVNVTVLADSDGDGMPDVYEAKHPVLNPKLDDGAADPDEDGLSNYQEWLIGTDPGNPDSDGDGISDSDELRAGSDPTRADSTPLPDLLFIANHHVDFGTWAGKVMKISIPVQVSAASFSWKAVSDQTWLTIAGGGKGNGNLNLTVNGDGLAAGRHLARVVVSAPGGQLNIIEVEMKVEPGNAADRGWMDIQ